MGRRGRLQIVLELTDRAEFADIRIDRLRLYLDPGGNGAIARSLYLAMRTQCRGVRVEDDSGRGYDLAPGIVEPVGFRPEEAVIPWPAKVAPGYRVLQEFFLFPDKFMFLDVRGLEGSARFRGQRLVLTFDLDEPFADASGLAPDSVRLNSTPVVNLFDAHADPVRVDHRRGEYRLTARDGSGNRHVIHSVRHVVGQTSEFSGGGERVEYAPLETFDVLGQVSDRACYALRRQRNPSTNAVETVIAFVRMGGAADACSPATVSCTVRCTNGTLPEDIPAGHVDQMTDGSPNFASFRDVQPIRPELPPPLEPTLMRRAIASVAGNFASMLDLEALRATLATCNARIHFDYMERKRHARLAEGIESIGATPLDWFVEGLPVRGWDVTVNVSESKLGGLGDACLFSDVLDAFFHDLAAINTVHRLTVVARETNRRFRAPVRVGRKAVL